MAFIFAVDPAPELKRRACADSAASVLVMYPAERLRMAAPAKAPNSKQNVSHAVMAQRSEALDSLDDFPTPPWATRALLKHAIPSRMLQAGQACLEPAAGRGHMSKVLWETFSDVHSSDIAEYGYGSRVDFLSGAYPEKSFDWVITNPPFRLAEEFVRVSLRVARIGVAMLVRTVFIESVGRFERLYKPYPLLRMAQFTERVPMVKGRLDKKASTATGYCWVIWEKNYSGDTQLVWIPACRKDLERDGDYGVAEIRQSAYSRGGPTQPPRVSAAKPALRDLFSTG